MSTRGTSIAMALSIGVHGFVLVLLGGRALPVAERAPRSAVSFEIATLPARPQAKPAEPDPPGRAPTSAPVARGPTRAPAVETKAAERPAEEPPEPAAPLDLTGVTLTTGDGAGWASLAGNGAHISGPIGVGRAKSPEVSRANAPGRPAAPAAPALVPAGELGQKPRPPALDARLRDNYPDAARAQGLSGTASVVARVEPDGAVRTGSVVAESSPGFGSACRATVIGSRWSPPRDRAGHAVATEVRYTCRFRVEQ
jgi:TonB family protein